MGLVHFEELVLVFLEDEADFVVEHVGNAGDGAECLLDLLEVELG